MTDGRRWNGLSDPNGSTIHKFRGLNFTDAMGDGTVVLGPGEVTGGSERGSRSISGTQHIDWCLVHNPPGSRASLQPVGAAVITELVASSAPEGGGERCPSDHFPVAVDFEIVPADRR